MRLSHVFSGFLFSCLVALSACTPAEAPAAASGDSCLDAAQIYTCESGRRSVLRCDESSLWSSAALCDDACEYVSPGDEAPGRPCCTVDGVYKCFDTPFCFGGCPVEENPGVETDPPEENAE